MTLCKREEKNSIIEKGYSPSVAVRDLSWHWDIWDCVWTEGLWLDLYSNSSGIYLLLGQYSLQKDLLEFVVFCRRRVAANIAFFTRSFDFDWLSFFDWFGNLWSKCAEESRFCFSTNSIVGAFLSFSVYETHHHSSINHYSVFIHPGRPRLTDLLKHRLRVLSTPRLVINIKTTFNIVRYIILVPSLIPCPRPV